MFPPPFKRSLVLTGPTGAGKTRLGIQLAQRLDAEIISMDSMALYRGMDIGTAKPTPEERRLVPHHLVDVLDPWESASVAWWLDQARMICQQIESRGGQVLFVGGTPLYLKALLHGLFDGPPMDEHLRLQLEDEARQAGPEALHARLATVDPVTATRLHPNDVRRVIRALEVWQLTGKPLSAWQQQWPRQDQPRHETDAGAPDGIAGDNRCLWLDLPRQEAYRRIDTRVREMVVAGLVEETRALSQLPRPLSREAAQALGYKEMLLHLQGTISLDEAVELIQRRSRRFAKRQLTWMRSLPQCRPVPAERIFLLWEKASL